MPIKILEKQTYCMRNTETSERRDFLDADPCSNCGNVSLAKSTYLEGSKENNQNMEEVILPHNRRRKMRKKMHHATMDVGTNCDPDDILSGKKSIDPESEMGTEVSLSHLARQHPFLIAPFFKEVQTVAEATFPNLSSVKKRRRKKKNKESTDVISVDENTCLQVNIDAQQNPRESILPHEEHRKKSRKRHNDAIVDIDLNSYCGNVFIRNTTCLGGNIENDQNVADVILPHKKRRKMRKKRHNPTMDVGTNCDRDDILLGKKSVDPVFDIGTEVSPSHHAKGQPLPNAPFCKREQTVAETTFFNLSHEKKRRRNKKHKITTNASSLDENTCFGGNIDAKENPRETILSHKKHRNQSEKRRDDAIADADPNSGCGNVSLGKSTCLGGNIITDQNVGKVILPHNRRSRKRQKKRPNATMDVGTSSDPDAILSCKKLVDTESEMGTKVSLSCLAKAKEKAWSENLCAEEENDKSIAGERETISASEVRQSDMMKQFESSEAVTSSKHGKQCTSLSHITSIDVINEQGTAELAVGLSKDESIKTLKRRRRSDRKRKKHSESSVQVLQSNDFVGETSMSCGDAKLASESSDGTARVDLLKDYPERLSEAVVNGLKHLASGAYSVESGPSMSCKEDKTCNQSCMNIESESLVLSSGKVEIAPLYPRDRGSHHTQSFLLPLTKAVGCPKRKLLILDVNGLLADIVPCVSKGYTPDMWISKKAVFRRPFCDNFLKFCFERYNVGIWSSRSRRNLDRVVDFLMGKARRKLLFCWNQNHCTRTGYKTKRNKNKPLMLKEIWKLWDKEQDDLPWKKGDYDESNTLLLDDSPYKALCNPPYTAIFPDPYNYKDVNDNLLGPGGCLHVYLEKLASADNVQKFVEENPFGQMPITSSNADWPFYANIINCITGRAEKNGRDESIKEQKGRKVIKHLRRNRRRKKRSSAS